MNIKEKVSVIALSIIEILVGILLLTSPMGLTSWIIVIAGIILTATGILKIVGYFSVSAEEAILQKSLAFGILAVLLGLCCMFRSEWFIALFPLLTTLYGILILINGVIKVQWTADMIRIKKRRWGWMALSAAVTVMCAIIILWHPFVAIAALWMFIGITMIVEAVIDIIAVIFIQKNKSEEENV